MRTYETCLISMSGKVTVYLSALYFSDTAAIHAARGLCKHGELIQIWRDDVCIHSDGIGQRIGPPSRGMRDRNLVKLRHYPTQLVDKPLGYLAKDGKLRFPRRDIL
jgi:hypothetical protein